MISTCLFFISNQSVIISTSFSLAAPLIGGASLQLLILVRPSQEPPDADQS